MKAKTVLLGLALLFIGGVLIIMIYKDNSNEVINNHEKDKTGLNIEELRKRLKEQGQWVSKDQANEKFSPNHNKSEPIVDDLELQLVEINDNGLKKIDFLVKNISDQEITLSFGTSQRYDFEIYNQANEKVYHYSEGKNFLQVIENTLLETGRTINYELTIPSLEAGEYTLIARLAAKDYGLLRAVTTFTIE